MHRYPETDPAQVTREGDPVLATSHTYTTWALRVQLRAQIQRTMQMNSKRSFTMNVLPDDFELLAQALEDAGVRRYEGASAPCSRAWLPAFLRVSLLRVTALIAARAARRKAHSANDQGCGQR